MSDRSSAWYANPENAERRKARMRAYGKALVALGKQFPEERSREYRAGVEDGLTPTQAQARAGKTLRAAHKAEFKRLFEEQLKHDGGTTQGPVPGASQQLQRLRP